MFYILRKDFSEKDRRKILLGLCDILKIEGVDSEIIISALKKGEFPDLEDCIQSRCANSIGAEYIITRNVRDFMHSDILAITPEEFLTKHFNEC